MARKRRSTATRPMQTKGEDNGQKKKASNGGCIARPTGAVASSARTGRTTGRTIAYAHASYIPTTSLKPLGLSQNQVPGSYQEHGPSLHPVRPGQLPSGPKGTGSHIGRRSSNTGGQGQTGRSETHPGPKTPSQVPQTTLFSTWSPSKQTRIIPLDRTTGLIRGSYNGFCTRLAIP